MYKAWRVMSSRNANRYMALALFIVKMGAKCANCADGGALLLLAISPGGGAVNCRQCHQGGAHKWPLYIGRDCGRIVAIVGAVL
jgi:hypothetical protein